MATPRAILDHLTTVLVATGAGLRPCDYRFPVEKQPLGGGHRRFEMLFSGSRITRQLFGAGYAAVDLDLRVRVAYARMGGDAGGATNGGDRKNVNVRAGEDGARIANALTMQPNWNQTTTGIREISLMAGGGWSRVVDGDKVEVYELRARVEINVEPWPVAPSP